MLLSNQESKVHEWHTRQQYYRDCVMGSWVSACSNLFNNHAWCIPSLSCLPFFLYHPFMPLFFLFAGFLIYLYKRSFAFVSYTLTHVSPLYCIAYGYLLLFTVYKQHCLRKVMDIYISFGVMGVESEEEENDDEKLSLS